MNPAPLVSIVLPVWNGEAYVAEAIESCIGQTLAEWELIVVDDASTDGTRDIVASYVERDGRIRLLQNAHNRRLPASLNRGFSRASGHFHTWLSDDNRFRPAAIERMSVFLKERSDIDMVYADYTIIDEEDRPRRQVAVEEPAQLIFENCVGPCFLYRREVHRRLGGYSEELYLAEDYDFWLRAAGQFRLERLPEDLYLYRHHPDSLSERSADAVRRASDRCLLTNLPHLRRLGRQATALSCLELARRAAHRHDALSLLEGSLKAFRYAPLLITARFARFFRRKLRLFPRTKD